MQGKRFVVTAKQQGGVEPLDVPRELPPGNRLLRITHSLISPGTELLIYRSGTSNTEGFAPGYTAVGTVDGKPVFLFPADDDQKACHATHKVVGSDALLVDLPEGLSPGRATFARMINVALTPYCYAGPAVRESVLVVGLGLVGNMAAQIGKARGMQVVGIDPDAARRQRAADVGIDHAIDPLAEGDARTVERVRDLTTGGAQLTINATGRTETFLPAIEATAAGGELSTLGAARNACDASLSAFLTHVQRRHITVRGGWEMLLPRRAAPGLATPSTQANLRLALRWLVDGTINLEPVWTHTIKPDDILDAYAALSRGDADWLGVVVDWTANTHKS